MQLYLLRHNELQTKVLPRKVSGQHTIEFTADNGELKTLVRINAHDDNWFISENKQVKIAHFIPKHNRPYGECQLEENALYYLRYENRENMILMVEPDKDDRKYYTHYCVPEGGIIDIGQAEYNRIQYEHPFINKNKHIQIHYQENNCILVTDREDDIPELKKNYAYINAERIKPATKAKIGDVIFLFGLKIVLGPDFIAVNNPDSKVKVRLEQRNYVRFLPKEDDEDEATTEKEYFSSAPRARREVIHRTFKIENPPEGLKEPDTPWIVMLGPSITMAMGSVFSSVVTINNILASSGNINNAMPSLITSIVMVMGSAIWPIIGRRVQKRSQVRKAAIASGDYEDYLNQLKVDIEYAIALQKDILQENNPTLEVCIQTILNVSDNLWERSRRHKDFLEIMIGYGDVKLDAAFSYPERGYHSEISQSARDMYDLVAGDHWVKNVPITLPLKDAGIVGVIGEREKVVEFGKALLLELTAMHNYEDLKIIFIYNENERSIWEFVKWIPHLWNDERTMRYLANDPDEVRNLSDYINNLMSIQDYHKNKEKQGPHYIIFAADKMLAERAQAIKELYQTPENSNITMIALYNERSKLPKACSYVIDLLQKEERSKNSDKDSRIAATLADYNDITGKNIICHDVILYDKNPEDIFVHMANTHLDSSSSAQQLPTQYTFMEMMEIGKPEHLDLIRRWKEHNAVNSLSTPIGIDADGYYINLDIHEKAHGPHGVIAGMTGSGKSEFIISYIVSLAVNYSPEDVAFVLIDFKGGGMADIFKNLPHTAGLITNLDGNELRRSFLAIERELEKRQKLFKEISDQKKISNIDIYKYQKLRLEDDTLKPLPHLILISDEFAELKQQHRDFMNQLIRIARIGRSLGVHLILATQKPDGVVDEQIKSNIRFKICLKVQDKTDSQSMIERPDATLITNSGRFYFKVGNDEVFEYGQSPWSGAAYEPQDHAVKNKYDYIEILNEQGMPILRESIPKNKHIPGTPEKQIDALVQFISETADENHMKAEKLWLSPLPAPKDEKKNEVIFDTEIRPFVLNPIIGMYDDLMNQKHLPLTIPFSQEGNALLYGTAGSGKLEFIISTLISIMNHHGTDEVNFYLCDYDSGSLEAFADSQFTKMFAGPGDRVGTEQLFDDIIYQMAERREMMRKYGGEYKNYIKSSGHTIPCLLLIIHNYVNLFDTYPDARVRITQIAREGVKYGIYIMLTGTASNSIPYALTPLFKNVYTLRQNTDDQYRDIVGKTEGITPEHYRGRGLVRVDGTVCEFQTDISFEDAENTYEAIQNFCLKKDREQKSGSLEKDQAPLPVPNAPLHSAGNVNNAGKRNKNNEESITLDKALYSLEKAPIAQEKTSGSLLTMDLTAHTASIIINDDLHMKQMKGLLSLISQLADNLYELSPEYKDLDSRIEQLWNMMLERGQIGSEAKKAGNPVPKFPLVMVIVRNPAAITEMVSSTARAHMVGLICKLSVTYRIHFVIFESIDNIFDLTQGKCLSPAMPFHQGIILTTDEAARALFADHLIYSGKARRPYGYIICDDKVQTGKILEVNLGE